MDYIKNSNCEFIDLKKNRTSNQTSTESKSYFSKLKCINIFLKTVSRRNNLAGVNDTQTFRLEQDFLPLR